MNTSPTDGVRTIAERERLSVDQFRTEILTSGKPATLRASPPIGHWSSPRASMHTALVIAKDYYHHVEALERFNVPVNYWWDTGEE